MACFADINVSQRSVVATYARCGGIVNIHEAKMSYSL